jgi:hypothetical protein
MYIACSTVVPPSHIYHRHISRERERERERERVLDIVSSKASRRLPPQRLQLLHISRKVRAVQDRSFDQITAPAKFSTLSPFLLNFPMSRMETDYLPRQARDKHKGIWGRRVCVFRTDQRPPHGRAQSPRYLVYSNRTRRRWRSGQVK